MFRHHFSASGPFVHYDFALGLNVNFVNVELSGGVASMSVLISPTNLVYVGLVFKHHAMVVRYVSAMEKFLEKRFDTDCRCTASSLSVHFEGVSLCYGTWQIL